MYPLTEKVLLKPSQLSLHIFCADFGVVGSRDVSHPRFSFPDEVDVSARRDLF
jgi:hypothetical protein